MIPNNILVAVKTYNEANLVSLQNQYAFIHWSNKRFDNFDQPANLGDTLLFKKPTRFQAADGLVWNPQPVVQRQQSLTVSESKNIPYEFNNQQFLFNVKDYMKEFGMNAMKELGAVIEADVAKVAETAPYLFIGDGTTAINSYLQLADAISVADEFGAAPGKKKGYLANRAVPSIVNSGLSQFAIDRNDKGAQSWMVADMQDTLWARSNMLPIHYAGTEGIANATLTVVSTTLDSNGAVISITFSGTTNASDPLSVKLHDNFTFFTGSANAGLNFLTFTGHQPCQLPVQFRATAAAASTGGSQVTVSVFPPLQVQKTEAQNITKPIVAGMQVKVLPSHRCGLLTSGDPIFLGMPRLPEQSPFASSSHTDMESGVSLRTSWGALLGQGINMLMGHDVIWGKTAVPENCVKIVFPLNT